MDRGGDVNLIGPNFKIYFYFETGRFNASRARYMRRDKNILCL